MDTRKHHRTLHLKRADLTSLTFLRDVQIAAIKSPTAAGSKATKLIPIYIRNTTDSQVCQRKASLGTPFQLSFWGEKKKTNPSPPHLSSPHAQSFLSLHAHPPLQRRIGVPW